MVMGTSGGKRDEEEFSVIGEKGEIGFIDYLNDKFVCSYNQAEEGPVFISVPFSFTEKPRSVFVGETTADSITIKNTTSESIELWSIRIYDSDPKNSFTLSLMKPPSKDSDESYRRSFLETDDLEDRVLQPNQLLTIWLSCKPKEIGLHTSGVHFNVDGDVIERVVLVLAEDKISQSLNSNKPYSRPIKKNHFNALEPVNGVRPASFTNRVNKPRLLRYDIPRDARELLQSKHIPNAVTEGLTEANYKSFFTNLLIMEELHMEDDMMSYDMERVCLRKKGTHYLALQVPGLAERRPSLVQGDYVCVQCVGDDADGSALSYQGYIHRVDADEVHLRFVLYFHSVHRDSDLFNVRFTYNRVNMRRLYQAVDVATKLDTKFLFPSISSKKRCIDTTPLVPISCILNEEQIFSVEMILGCKEAPPYVIFGPPGTGKTMTLVEAILQLYKTRENSLILVCAASNSAADYILEKLINEKDVPVQQNELFRLNATSRAYGDINPDYMRFCFSEELIFMCPPLDALMRYRIIISTYMSASTLFAEGVQKGHFSHIFLDEAGQATEPETMIPLSNFCQKDTVVVLAGDPMQLGPVVHSRVAENLGLGKSYLQRLFECEFYHSEDENYVTKLVRNYRSHPEILYLPSKLFYQGELIACNDDIAPSMSFVDILPNKEFPVLFIGVQGCDEREGSNPSWFNRFEASKVVEIIKKLTLTKELNEKDIGVITPYRQQVLKIKSALDTLDMGDIKVGSVEQFQGQERQVIIISSVRSTIKHNEFDRTFCLGFLSNPRRFNVAITRPKSLLIIIGNPHIVCKDPYWNKLLWRCSDNGSYQGCALPDRQEYPDDDPPEQDDGFNCKGQENDQESFQPVWNEEVAWGQEPSQSEWSEKPVTDDAQWSTGWKDSESNQGQEENYVTRDVDWNREEKQAEWSHQQPFQAEYHVNQEVEWNQESKQAEWNQESNLAEWNQESNLAEWGQEAFEAQNHMTQKGKWNRESDQEDWNQKSFGRNNHVRNTVEWNREFYQGETSGKAANDEVYWTEQYSQPVWKEKPVTNQAEWNDWNV